MEKITEKIDWTKVAEKAKAFFKNLGKAAVIVIAIGVGFASAEIYHFIQVKSKAQNLQIVKKMCNTSVAMNERNELMIINRVDGTYQIFQDSVGIQIFKLYANGIHMNINSEMK
jgi:hypothetical protein